MNRCGEKISAEDLRKRNDLDQRDTAHTKKYFDRADIRLLAV